MISRKQLMAFILCQAIYFLMASLGTFKLTTGEFIPFKASIYSQSQTSLYRTNSVGH